MSSIPYLFLYVKIGSYVTNRRPSLPMGYARSARNPPPKPVPAESDR